MPSVWNDADRADLVRRMWTLTPHHTAKWGKFLVGGMLAHLNHATRMASGELTVAGKGPSFLRWPLVGYLFLRVLPIPKGAPTAPELLEGTGVADLAQEQQHFQALIDELPHKATLAAEHPAFGPLTRDDWGVLVHKHVDHHLRQFGV